MIRGLFKLISFYSACVGGNILSIISIMKYKLEGMKFRNADMFRKVDVNL